MTALLLLALLAPHHAVGLSRGVYVVAGSDVDIELTLARPELLGLVKDLDSNHDGALAEDELTAARDVLTVAVQRGLRLSRGDAACDVVVEGTGLVEEDGVVIAARARCGAGAADVVVDFAFVENFAAPTEKQQSFAAGHRHLGTVKTQAGSHDVVAFAGAREFTLVDSDAAPPVGAYLVLGVEHILLGFDHLVFLLGVLIVLLRGGTWRSLLMVITAFTLAHSITLGLAATGTLVPPSRTIEILIAASIVFVGVESFFARSVAGRWKVTLPFGLIHGFGFAGALSEIGLPRDHLIPALALFNVGVEVGQLVAVALATPLLLLLRARLDERQRDRLVNVVAAAVVVAGSVWMVERIVG